MTPGRGEPVPVAVWYPALQRGTPVVHGDNAVFQGMTALENAPVVEQRFPLVVIAHGGFRSAANAASWLASALASTGFVAAVVTPPARPGGPPRQSVLDELWLRPADLSATIDALEKEPTLADHIDPDKVAGLGFFLGGYSVLSLAGARLDPKAYAHACDTADSGLDCHWFAQGHVDPSRIDPILAGGSHLDPRLKLAIVSNPELTGFLSDDSLHTIAIPVRVIELGGTANGVGAGRGSALVSRIPLARDQRIAGSGPFSSFPDCKPKGRAILADEGGETKLCDDGTGKSRSTIHAELAVAVIEALRQSFALP